MPLFTDGKQPFQFCFFPFNGTLYGRFFSLDVDVSACGVYLAVGSFLFLF